MTMSDIQADEWLDGITATLETVQEMAGEEEYNQEWVEQVLHVAEHVTEADIHTLREAFLILAAQAGDGPAKAHAAIVGARLLAEDWYAKQARES